MAYSDSRYSRIALTRASATDSPRALASARNSRHACGDSTTDSTYAETHWDLPRSPAISVNFHQMRFFTRTWRGSDASGSSMVATPHANRAAVVAAMVFMPLSLPQQHVDRGSFVVRQRSRCATVVLAPNSTKPRLSLEATTGSRRNQPFSRTVAKMMLPTAAVVVPNDAADVTYHVECGECPNDLGTPRTARFAVVYETVTVDGEPGVERLFSCSPCLGAVVGWANDHHDGFTPPTISKLPELAGPRCPWCHAPYVGCVTNFRGICIKSPVAAR